MFKEKFLPAEVKREDLLNKVVMNFDELFKTGVPEDDKELLEVSVGEVSKGWLEGPLSKEE
eukprot:3325891-Amphidinium_carterae.1